MTKRLQVVIDFDIEANDENSKSVLQDEIDYFVDRLENSIGLPVLTPNIEIIKEFEE